MKTLGDRIRELREENDLTLRELAARIDVTASFISDIELGRRDPSDERIRQLAKILGTTVEDLDEFSPRLPIREMRRSAREVPRYGYALREMVDRRVSPAEILEYIDNKEQGMRESR